MKNDWKMIVGTETQEWEWEKIEKVGKDLKVLGWRGGKSIDIETLRWSRQRTVGIDLDLEIAPASTAEGGTLSYS